MNPEELRDDAELKARIEKAQSLPEVAEIFREKGIEITDTELSQLLATEQELGEDELETAAGGTYPLWGVRAFRAIVKWLQSRGGGRGAAGGGGGMGGR